MRGVTLSRAGTFVAGLAYGLGRGGTLHVLLPMWYGHHPRRAILQFLRESGGRGAHRSSGSRGPTRLRRTGSTAHSASGHAVAGDWSSALRGSGMDFYRRAHAAVLGRLGTRDAVHELAL